MIRRSPLCILLARIMSAMSHGSLIHVKLSLNCGNLPMARPHGISLTLIPHSMTL